MRRAPLPLLLVSLTIAGCGGSGNGAPATRLVLTPEGSDFSGSSRAITAMGTGSTSPGGAQLTFRQDNRYLDVTLPSAESGTYAFGDLATEAQASYEEIGIATSQGWTTDTAGSVTVVRNGTTLRLTFTGVRFRPETGGPGVQVTGAFLLTGTGRATTQEDTGGGAAAR